VNPAPHVLALCGDDPWTIRREVAKATLEVPAEWHSLAVRRFWGEDLPPGELLAEISTPAFGTPLKVLVVERMHRVADKASLVEAVKAAHGGCRLILIQDEPKFTHKALETALTKHGQIRKLYPPHGGEIRKRLSLLLGEEGITPDEEALAFLVPALEQDPGSLEGEVHKIALFLADLPPGKKRLDAKAARDLSGTGRDHDPFLFPKLFLTRERKKCMSALLDHIHHGQDLLSLCAITTSELWKTLVYLEGRTEGLPEGDLWKRTAVYWPMGQRAIQENARFGDVPSLRVAIKGFLELEQIMKRDSLVSEGVEGDRLHLSGFLHLCRLITFYAR
jgi:DNA polymerase III delta subunit